MILHEVMEENHDNDSNLNTAVHYIVVACQICTVALNVYIDAIIYLQVQINYARISITKQTERDGGRCRYK